LNRRKVFQKFRDRIPVFETIEEVLNRNTSASKNRSAAQNFRIDTNNAFSHFAIVAQSQGFSSLFHSCWMTAQMSRLEFFDGDMRINLGGFELSMTEHDLDVTDITAVLKKSGCECVTKQVATPVERGPDSALLALSPLKRSLCEGSPACPVWGERSGPRRSCRRQAHDTCPVESGYCRTEEMGAGATAEVRRSPKGGGGGGLQNSRDGGAQKSPPWRGARIKAGSRWEEYYRSCGKSDGVGFLRFRECADSG